MPFKNRNSCNNNYKKNDHVTSKVTFPYDFVPLNHKVLIPEWGDKISQDIPFEDGEDGTITVTFKNVTPLFIKNGMRDKKKDPNTGNISVDIKPDTPAYEDTLSAHIGNQDGKRQFFIPASSLKGMIRSVMEVFSFCKMEQYNDHFSGKKIEPKKRVSEGISQKNYFQNGTIAPNTDKDLVNCIFGCVNSDRSKDVLRGRVQFCNAFCSDNINSYNEDSGVLGQPKSCFYPFYIKQNSHGSYITYDNDKIEIAGRKFYCIHEDEYITKIPGGKNKKIYSCLKLIPKGHLFVAKINLHNMRPVEIGAILSALTFHQHEECFHNVGMGKSYGYGKLQIESLSMKGTKKDKTYYLEEYEKYMSNFTQSFLRKSWKETDQFKKMLAIASNHNENLEIMALADYTNLKRNRR
jgi:CRISPR/Cas system CSM-associated protein Csm3 (group 7 of RAMP superfamily)